MAAMVMPTAGCAAGADVVATYRYTIGHVRIEASATGWGRIESWSDGKRPDGFELVTPAGRNLHVFQLNGRWIVGNSADYTEWTLRNWHPRQSLPPDGHFVKTGEEKIGAWTGTGYTMRTGKDDRLRGYCGSWSHLVVLSEPGLEGFGRVMSKNLRYANGREAPPPCYLQAVALMGKGVTLFVDDPQMQLETLERRRVDPARFRPPSRVLSRAELFALLNAAHPDVPTTIVAPPPT
jgi:hypothetical protein